jgi:hypothetical protein
MSRATVNRVILLMFTPKLRRRISWANEDSSDCTSRLATSEMLRARSEVSPRRCIRAAPLTEVRNAPPGIRQIMGSCLRR